MKRNISTSFVEVLLSARDDIKALYEVRVNYVRQIHLAFAGGGGHLEFIRSCIPSEVDVGEGIVLPIKVVEFNAQQKGLSNESPTKARLAVCEGGVISPSNWPTSNPEARRFGPLDFGAISTKNVL